MSNLDIDQADHCMCYAGPEHVAGCGIMRNCHIDEAHSCVSSAAAPPAAPAGGEHVAVSKVQVGLLGSARQMQRDLDRVTTKANTETVEGLHLLLQGDACTALLSDIVQAAHGTDQACLEGCCSVLDHQQQLPFGICRLMLFVSCHQANMKACSMDLNGSRAIRSTVKQMLGIDHDLVTVASA